MSGLFGPLVSFDTIERDELNHYLVKWGHKLGPLNRPEFKPPIDFVVREGQRAIAVIASDTLIRDTCELTRSNAFELSRLCGAQNARLSVAMKLWREFGYPLIVRKWKTPWAVSYQDATRHRGRLYRYDHWLVLGYTNSGTDSRAAAGTASVRRKVVWGWNADAAAMAERRKLPIDTPRWAERLAA